jgi:anti-anti-sigma regulatory factor
MKPSILDVRQQTEGETVALSTEDELDVGSIPVLAQRTDAEIGGDDQKGLILDLSDVNCMDPPGLPGLIELNKRAGEA